MARPNSPDPVLAAAGRKGMRSRWGPPRRARLDDLTLEQRNIVLALIDAAKAARQAEVEPASNDPAAGSMTTGGTTHATPVD